MALRQKRSPEERREQILRAAESLFAEQGFERTTTREIAQVADISEGTIYKYFESKQQILFAMVSHMIEPLAELFAEQQDADDEAIIKTFIRSQFEFFDRKSEWMLTMFSELRIHPELMKEYFQSVAQPALQVLEHYISRRIEAGAFRQVNPTVVVISLLGTLRFYHIVCKCLLAEQVEPLPREELIEELATFFLRGLRNDPASIA